MYDAVNKNIGTHVLVYCLKSKQTGTMYITNTALNYTCTETLRRDRAVWLSLSSCSLAGLNTEAFSIAIGDFSLTTLIQGKVRIRLRKD